MSIQNLLLLLLLLPLISSAFEESKNSIELTALEGMVYCQSCEHAGSWSLAGAEPLASAKVGIACRDHKKRVWFYGAFQADKNGYYYAPIRGLEGEGVKKGINGCSVHLLSSPDSNCNLLTNVNLGIAGAGVGEGKKKVLKEKGYGVAVYAAPPLAFRRASCALAAH